MIISAKSVNDVFHVDDSNPILQLILESEPADIDAPILFNSSPSREAIALVNTNIELTFNEFITAGHGNIIITNGSDIRTIAIDDTSQVLIFEDMVTINPAQDFLPFTNYHVEIESSAIEDLSGNSFVDIRDEQSTFSNVSQFSFNTIPDSFSPRLIFTSFDNDLAVKIDQNIELKFNETVKTGDGNLIVGSILNGSLISRSIAVTDTSLVTFDNDTLIINLAEDLIPDTQHTFLHVSNNAVTDLSGNPFFSHLEEGSGFAIRTITSNPLLISHSPLDGSDDFQVDSPIKLIFDEQVTAGSGDIIVSNGLDVRTIDVNDDSQVSFDEEGTVTINPLTDLIPSTRYNVQVADGVIVDTRGNPYAGVSDSTTLDFSTITSNPQLSFIQPVSLNGEYLVDGDIELVFNENIVAGSGDITISSGLDTRTIAIGDASQVTINDNSITINPTADLDPNTRYGINIGDGVILDTVGNAYSGTNNTAAFSFTALSADPLLISSTPLNGSDEFQVFQDIQLHFDKFVTAGIGNIIISNGSDTRTIAIDDSSQVSFSGSKVTINPTADLLGDTTYSIQLSGGAVVDTAGNPYAGFNEGTFTTLSAPEFNFIELNNELALKSDSNIELYFNREIIAGSGDIIIGNDSDTRVIAIDDASQISFDHQTVIINPTANLDADTIYRIEFASGVIMDTTGNNFPGISDLSITTKNIDPILMFSYPLNNAEFKADKDIELYFDENVIAGVGNLVISNGLDTRIIPIDDESQVTFDEHGVVVIDPTEDLIGSTTYSAQMESGVIVDVAGNAYGGFSDVSFSVVPTDPVLSLSSPQDNEAFKIDDYIQLKFDEAVTAGSGDIIISNGVDKHTIPVSDTQRVNFDFREDTVTIFPPEELIVDTTYNIQITDGAIVDLKGNTFKGINDESTLDFTTISSDPTLIFSHPRNQSVHKIGDPIMLYFDEQVMADSGHIIISNDSDTRAISIDDSNQVSFNLNSIAIHLTERLVANTTYNVQIANGVIVDLEGNAYAGFDDGGFSTTTTAPVLTTFTDPINGSAFEANRNIELRFDEGVVAGSGNIVISNGSDVRTIAINDTNQVDFKSLGTFSFTPSDGETNVIVINPTDDLIIGTTYTIQMGEGVVTDREGHAYVGINGATAISFDTIDPSVSSELNFGFTDSYFSDPYLIEPFTFHGSIF